MCPTYPLLACVCCSTESKIDDAPTHLCLQPWYQLDCVLAADGFEIGGRKPEFFQVFHLVEPEIRIVRTVSYLRHRHEFQQRCDRWGAGRIRGVVIETPQFALDTFRCELLEVRPLGVK